jgi:Ubiquitin C-terminal hydrolase
MPSSHDADTQTCPYLDTVNRTCLDFDFEPTCSQTLTAGPNIYACLVCGVFFRGRGKQTPAYLHSVNEGHAVFLHLTNGTFHCLPENYEIRDPSLNDIRDAFKPVYTEKDIQCLDQQTNLGRDLLGRRYLPGFVGLNNLNKTDCINSVLQALAHVKPLRNFFLLCGSGKPFEVTLQIESGSNKSNTNITKKKRRIGEIEGMNVGSQTKPKKVIVDPSTFSHLAKCFGEMVRKMWSNKRFKATVDPHMLVQAISVASNKRFSIGKQMEASEFLAWLLHQLHVGVGGTRKAGSSIIHATFQGKVEITTQQKKTHKEEVTSSNDNEEGDDDRLGSDDEETFREREEERKRQREEENKNNLLEEVTSETNFLQLTLDIPEKPLFKDDNGGLVIPQEPLVNILRKFDGLSFNDVINTSIGTIGGSITQRRRRYRIQKLPNYLILCLARFKRNTFNNEKNPTIVPFPVKNLDLSHYVFSQESSMKQLPTEEEVRAMSVSILCSL